MLWSNWRTFQETTKAFCPLCHFLSKLYLDQLRQEVQQLQVRNGVHPLDSCPPQLLVREPKTNTTMLKNDVTHCSIFGFGFWQWQHTTRVGVLGRPDDQGTPIVWAGHRSQVDKSTPSRGRWPEPEAELHFPSDRKLSSPTRGACPLQSTCRKQKRVNMLNMLAWQ